MWCEIVRHCVKTLEWELLRQYYTSWCNNIEILHLESLVFLTSRQRRVSQTPQPNEVWLPRRHSAYPTQPPDILFKSQRSAISVQFSGHSKTLVWYSLPGLDKWPWKSNGHVLQLNMTCPLISFYDLIILLHIQVSAGGASYCWRRRCLAWPEMEMSCMARDGDIFALCSWGWWFSISFILQVSELTRYPQSLQINILIFHSLVYNMGNFWHYCYYCVSIWEWILKINYWIMCLLKPRRSIDALLFSSRQSDSHSLQAEVFEFPRVIDGCPGNWSWFGGWIGKEYIC
jgi:hypothetical protein